MCLSTTDHQPLGYAYNNFRMWNFREQFANPVTTCDVDWTSNIDVIRALHSSSPCLTANSERNTLHMARIDQQALTRLDIPVLPT